MGAVYTYKGGWWRLGGKGKVRRSAGVGRGGGAGVHRAFLLNFNVFVGVGIYFCWRALSVGALTTCLCDGVHRNRQAWLSIQPDLQGIRVLKCDSFTRGIPFLTGRHHCVQSLDPYS